MTFNTCFVFSGAWFLHDTAVWKWECAIKLYE